MTDEKNSKKYLPLFKWIIPAVIVLIVLVALGSSMYFYSQYKKAQKLLQNPTFSAQQQTQDLLTAVGKLIELPKGETPTIATVSDVTKLSGQPFFQNAKNGDKVLIYTNAKEAILYRPSENKIIAVAPVNIGGVTPTPTPTKTVKRVTPTPTK